MSEEGRCDMSWKEDWEPNLDQFSFENELKARKLQSKIYINALRTKECFPTMNSLEENEINKLEKQLNELKSKDNFLLTELLNLNMNLKKLLEEIENLKKENTKLDIELSDLEKKETTLREEYKLNKEAYNIALGKYCTNFDFEINTKSISDEVFKATVKFASIKNMSPIKITINRKQKEILDFDVSNLLTKEEINILTDNQDILENVPILFARIRQHLIRKITS